MRDVRRILRRLALALALAVGGMLATTARTVAAEQSASAPESQAKPEVAAPGSAKPAPQAVPPQCAECGMRGCGCGEQVGNEPKRPAGSCGCMQRKLGGQ